MDMMMEAKVCKKLRQGVPHNGNIREQGGSRTEHWKGNGVRFILVHRGS